MLLLGLASVAITTRYLGPAATGASRWRFSLTSSFGVLADAGLTTIVVRELAQRPERAPAVRRARRSRCARGWRPPRWPSRSLLALALPYPRDVRVAVLIAGVPLALGLASAFAAVLQSGLHGGARRGADVAGRAAALAAVALVAALDLGFYAVVAAAGVGAAVTLASRPALARPLLPARARAPERGAGALLLGAALPLGAALAVNEAYFRADALIISLVAAVRRARPLRARLAGGELAGRSPRRARWRVFPLLARYAPRATRGCARRCRRRSTCSSCRGVAIAVGGALVAPAAGAARWAATPSRGAAAPLRVLLCAAALGFVNGLLGHALIARDLQLARSG